MDGFCMKKKIVEIKWRDPTIDAGWVDEDHEKPLPIMRTYGILISKTKEQVVIGGTYDREQKKYADRTKFPLGCVVEIRVIETVDLK
jgi:hypothetical protein